MVRRILEPGPPRDRGEEETPDAPNAVRTRRKPLAKGGAAAPRYIQGSVQSASDRSHQDISVDQIRDSAIRDRINLEEGLDELADSIRENGQKIPIIVRIVQGDHPYEIVAGRRRLAAMRRLGLKTIQGFITRLDDREAFLVQGIENSDRLETSFIERARVASQSLAAGFNQEDVAKFVGTTQPIISTMKRIYEAIGEDLVLAIGPARGVGRRRWDDLAKLIATRSMTSNDALPLLDEAPEDSSARFEHLIARLSTVSRTGRNNGSKPSVTKRAQGRISLSRKSRQLVLKAEHAGDVDFLDYLSGEIDELYRTYAQQKGGKN